MIMCITMLSITQLYPSDLYTITISTYPIYIYCIVDIYYNTWDMILHHVFTLMLGYVLSIRYIGQNEELIIVMAKAFINTEISTLFLNLLHLRYKHILIKISFITTFFYYRIICIMFLLFINPTTCYFCNQSDFICGDDTGCHVIWPICSGGLMTLNIFWLTKILGKVIKKS